MRTEDIIGACVVAAAVGVALVRVATSGPSHIPHIASASLGYELYVEDADKEPGDRRDSSRRFRGSPWSADDDFHFKESKRVKGLAKNRDVTMTSLLDWLDRGIHQSWPTLSNNVVNPKVMPCRPRLNY